ncbi:MAG TPA: N-acetylmuramoyl-L-alanine amidase [Gemmatimonadales bacterium]|nr:N-acetylmuramoyl-L-alanine amidase [Gemmatimonadales bacterium]
MIGLLVGLAVAAPDAVLIATSRGETRVPVSLERGAPALAAPHLARPLGLRIAREGTRAAVELAQVTFLFEVGSPYVRVADSVYSLLAAPYVARDTVFLPLDWLAGLVPRVLAGRYRWDPAAGRLAELAMAAAPMFRNPAGTAAGAPHPLTGLVQRHTVVIDPGHGGRDPGNPGLYFPGRMTEKDVTLAIGKLLRAELERRGLDARLTRTTDTLVDLADRGALCRADCDLFVSIHVNAMPGSRRQDAVRGVETYFLSDAKTEDQKRVARMENDAIRFEADTPVRPSGDLAFILRDLQQNEYLRESARAAELVQGRLAGVHPGGDRGVQQAGFMVLSTARRPAILIEAGFATNREDAEFLTSTMGQRRIVNAIADGVVAYLLEFERKLAVGGVP